MVKVRQDAWSHEGDLLLAETVLRHIREGSTQLNAFEEVGDKLNRTSAACGFRWNAEVRQRYEQAVSIAKRQRKEKKRALAKQQKVSQQHIPMPAVNHVPKQLSQPTTEDETVEETIATTTVSPTTVEVEPVQTSSLDLDTVINYLHSLREDYYESSLSASNLEQMQKENEMLREENEAMEKKINKLQEQLNTVQEDYQVLIQIMDRARKMVVFDEGDDVTTPAFRMEKNGNLEQVAK